MARNPRYHRARRGIILGHVAYSPMDGCVEALGQVSQTSRESHGTFAARERDEAYRTACSYT
eukprot:1200444-Rhodomonas_salina.1